MYVNPENPIITSQPIVDIMARPIMKFTKTHFTYIKNQIVVNIQGLIFC